METFNARPVWSRSWFIDVAFVASVVACSLVIWSAACGINRRDEVSAGAVALVVMVVWWLVLLLLWVVLLKGSTEEDTARLRAIGVGSAPLGFLPLRDIPDWDSICKALGYSAVVAIHVLLAAWYVVRFGRTAEREFARRASRSMSCGDWNSSRRRDALRLQPSLGSNFSRAVQSYWLDFS